MLNQPGPNNRKVTFATMISTGGGVTTYGVYRGLLRRTDRPTAQQFIKYDDSHCQRVATITVRKGEQRPTYMEMARRYETAEHPAFNWGREDVHQ